MSLQTGGRAVGATSTRSRSASWASRRASPTGARRTCAPFGPTSRTSGTRIRSLMRGSTLMGPPRLADTARALTMRKVPDDLRPGPRQTTPDRPGSRLDGADRWSGDGPGGLAAARVGVGLRLLTGRSLSVAPARLPHVECDEIPLSARACRGEDVTLNSQ